MKELLEESGYPPEEIKFLVKGFSTRFDLGYAGPTCRQNRARNLPFNTGNKFMLWEKVMKEVKLNRYAGPFVEIPFTNYVQSPFGLVPKGENGKDVRLIFHLSYDFLDNYKLVNAYTPKEMCTVKYKDLDHAVQEMLRILKNVEYDLSWTEGKQVIVWYGKTDLKSAFCLLCLHPSNFWLLIMAAEEPLTGKTYFFVDKCLLFRHSISCALFQRFSDGLAHITKHVITVNLKVQNPPLTNYLDDFLFVASRKALGDAMLRTFLDLCQDLGIPVSEEKTEWANTLIIFLGILLDGMNLVLAVPEEKRIRALNSLELFQHKKKATVKEL